MLRVVLHPPLPLTVSLDWSTRSRPRTAFYSSVLLLFSFLPRLIILPFICLPLFSQFSPLTTIQQHHHIRLRRKEKQSMGVYPSKTELFLPSETLLRCTPDRCWCKGHHHRGDSRYVYVERGGDGRERYHDGFDMMSQLMGNGNGMGGVWPAWKDPSQWNIRDMERFTEFFSEWQNREMGRKGRVNGAAGPGGIYGYGGGGVGRGEFERMQSEMEERFKRMAEEYARGNEERDAFLFGSERERRKEMFQGQIWRMIQEMWPQLASMASSGGGMMGGAMGFPPGMGGPIGAGFGGPWGGMANMGGGGSPMGWMGNGNGMAGAMPNMPFQSPMDADGYGRRNYRRGRPRPYGFADEELEEHVGLANPYPSMRGHGPRTVPRHRFGDEGDFGGLGGGKYVEPAPGWYLQ